MKNIVIVTGASSGIGRAIAKRFAAADYEVVAAGRDRARLSGLESEAPGITIWSGDLSSPPACRELVEHCMRLHGRLDVLVNNAGIYFRRDTLATSDEDWRQTLAVNLDAPFFLSRAALPHLRSQGGVIINIASDWGIRGGRKAAAYCASKGGLVLLTKAMALDHAAEGIRVVAICPGDVDTPMLEQEAAVDGLSAAEALREYGRQSPSGRVTEAGEVAALALFLASAEAAQITGAAIPIDGGNTA
ncbi:MAG TPA: SDR family oxidoreductase [Xanthomonadales bacterium]|nr:SDR family oxidoreductase [Xanthomonadales bacterium]